MLFTLLNAIISLALIGFLLKTNQQSGIKPEQPALGPVHLPMPETRRPLGEHAI